MLTVALVVAAGCRRDGATSPSQVKGTATPAVLLSTGSPTKDEDPSVLRAGDGTLLIAWFSDRGNNSDIYVSRSVDKRTWNAPVRVTPNVAGDFYPNLLEDAQGMLHLVWFQWVSLRVGQIRHSTSPDGVNWSSEEAVTTQLLVDDWVPTITEAPDGSLVVYFVSDKRGGANATADMYLARKRVGSSAWDAPALVSVNSAAEHDQLPFVARMGNQLGMVWVRHDTSNPDFISNPKSELYYATSSDGLTWSAPLQVTKHSGNVVNLFPQLFQRHDGS